MRIPVGIDAAGAIVNPTLQGFASNELVPERPFLWFNRVALRKRAG